MMQVVVRTELDGEKLVALLVERYKFCQRVDVGVRVGERVVELNWKRGEVILSGEAKRYVVWVGSWIANMSGVQEMVVDAEELGVEEEGYMVGELASEENYRLDHPESRCVGIKVGDEMYGCDEEEKVVELAIKNKISWWKVQKEV